jgi:hypothetical protein
VPGSLTTEKWVAPVGITFRLSSARALPLEQADRECCTNWAANFSWGLVGETQGSLPPAHPCYHLLTAWTLGERGMGVEAAYGQLCTQALSGLSTSPRESTFHLSTESTSHGNKGGMR